MKFRQVVTIAASTEGDGEKRTDDVKISEDVDFSALLLSAPVLEGLKRSGFKKPSPVQLKAVPIGRLGLDLIVQAKSGTGKTLVFSIIALESVVISNRSPQVLVLAPTREIAQQIHACMLKVGSVLMRDREGMRCGLFIGGTDLKENIRMLKWRSGCHIIIGSPGRICQLVSMNQLKLDSIRLLVLDEADKMMEDNFQENVNWIFSQMPASKQVSVFSATYPDRLDEFLSRYMISPTMIRLDSGNVQLIGIKQYLSVIPQEEGMLLSENAQDLPEHEFKTTVDYDKVVAMKIVRLDALLHTLSYQQVLVFCNYQDKAETVCKALQDRGWEAQFISAQLDQDERSQIMRDLKKFKTRLLVSTDLTARGIDAHNVNLVVNFEVPLDPETYFHRIGRAGRFGGYGAAISLVVENLDEKRFLAIGAEGELNTKILPLPGSGQLVTDVCSNMPFWESQPSVHFPSKTESRRAFAPKQGPYRLPNDRHNQSAADSDHQQRRSKREKKASQDEFPFKQRWGAESQPRPDPKRFSADEYMSCMPPFPVRDISSTQDSLHQNTASVLVYPREVLLDVAGHPLNIGGIGHALRVHCTKTCANDPLRSAQHSLFLQETNVSLSDLAVMESEYSRRDMLIISLKGDASLKLTGKRFTDSSAYLLHEKEKEKRQAEHQSEIILPMQPNCAVISCEHGRPYSRAEMLKIGSDRPAISRSGIYWGLRSGEIVDDLFRSRQERKGAPSALPNGDTSTDFGTANITQSICDTVNEPPRVEKANDAFAPIDDLEFFGFYATPGARPPAQRLVKTAKRGIKSSSKDPEAKSVTEVVKDSDEITQPPTMDFASLLAETKERMKGGKDHVEVLDEQTDVKTHAEQAHSKSPPSEVDESVLYSQSRPIVLSEETDKETAVLETQTRIDPFSLPVLPSVPVFCEQETTAQISDRFEKFVRLRRSAIELPDRWRIGPVVNSRLSAADWSEMWRDDWWTFKHSREMFASRIEPQTQSEALAVSPNTPPQSATRIGANSIRYSKDDLLNVWTRMAHLTVPQNCSWYETTVNMDIFMHRTFPDPEIQQAEWQENGDLCADGEFEYEDDELAYDMDDDEFVYDEEGSILSDESDGELDYAQQLIEYHEKLNAWYKQAQMLQSMKCAHKTITGYMNFMKK